LQAGALGSEAAMLEQLLGSGMGSALVLRRFAAITEYGTAMRATASSMPILGARTVSTSACARANRCAATRTASAAVSEPS
jgi:hypothetical protein